MNEPVPINPFAAPETPVGGFLAQAPITDVEGIRRAHLSHETNIKSLGALYLLGAIVSLAIAIVAILVEGTVNDWFAVIFLVTIPIGGVSGYGLRGLHSWVKIPAAIIGVIQLFSIGVGTIIGICTLYFVFSKKGKFILTPEYHEIIRQTPHVKYKTSWIVWVFLGLVLLLILLAVVGSVTTRATKF
jgi:hypothetical protein